MIKLTITGEKIPDSSGKMSTHIALEHSKQIPGRTKPCLFVSFVL